MSNFLNKGRRMQKVAEKKEVKKRIKHVYNIMEELDITAAKIYRSREPWGEHNIQEIARKHTDINIGSMEGFLLLGKLQNIVEHYDKLRENAEEAGTFAVREGDPISGGEVQEEPGKEGS